MTGRGIDQILPRPADPRLHEPHMRTATGYVALAEKANGPIPRPADPAYIWGDALGELGRRRPDARIINLETAVTRHDTPEPKGINYRMSPENLSCITRAGIDCCVLANNHVLDWGPAGLFDTITTIRAAGMRTAGAGRNAAAAAAPAVLPVAGRGRVLVFAYGSVTSGIPPHWKATMRRPGVNLLDDLSPATARRIGRIIAAVRRPGDVVVASIHWGANWDFAIPRDQRRFAHALIDEAGVGLVHGHSSHHVKAIELHRGRPILYGCGDLLNDYEGIGGYEGFRDDLGLMYFATMDPRHGLVELEMVPMRIRRFRLNRASPGETLWLRDTLNREGARFGTRVGIAPNGALRLDARG